MARPDDHPIPAPELASLDLSAADVRTSDEATSALPQLRVPQAAPTAQVIRTSYVLMAAALLLVMWQGLLPGLLCACLGFVLTRGLAKWMARAGRYVQKNQENQPALSENAQPSAPLPASLQDVTLAPAPTPRWALVTAATAVCLWPLLLLTGALSQTSSYIVAAPHEYRGLLDYLSRTVLELGEKLPPELAAQLPQGAADMQRVIANYLSAQAGTLAQATRVWLAGLLHAYVGLLIGALAAQRGPLRPAAPLSYSLHRRVSLLGEAFMQIVAAQFWIALFNTVLTALFLIFLLPLWDIHLPYAPALIALTFFAGLIPIVGNLFCNLVLTLVGLSVSPMAAIACLSFLILIHKAEYFINARVVGQRTHMAVWELLAVMFVSESIFGPPGLVAAPLFYAYLKKELEAAKMV